MHTDLVIQINQHNYQQSWQFSLHGKSVYCVHRKSSDNVHFSYLFPWLYSGETFLTVKQPWNLHNYIIFYHKILGVTKDIMSTTIQKLGWTCTPHKLGPWPWACNRRSTKSFAFQIRCTKENNLLCGTKDSKKAKNDHRICTSKAVQCPTNITCLETIYAVRNFNNARNMGKRYKSRCAALVRTATTSGTACKQRARIGRTYRPVAERSSDCARARDNKTNQQEVAVAPNFTERGNEGMNMSIHLERGLK